jgi:hypothetical protein
VGLAGCAALGDEPESTSTPTAIQTDTRTPESTTSPSPEPTPTPRMDRSATAKYREPDDGYPIPSNLPDEYLEVDIGSREGVEQPDDNRGNGVALFRSESVEAVFEVQIVDMEANSVRHHGIYEVPADRRLELSLNEPSDYAVNIYDHAHEQGWTVTVGRGFFDCNHRRHWVYSVDGDEFGWNVHSTMKGCDI